MRQQSLPRKYTVTGVTADLMNDLTLTPEHQQTEWFDDIDGPARVARHTHHPTTAEPHCVTWQPSVEKAKNGRNSERRIQWSGALHYWANPLVPSPAPCRR